MNEPGSHANLVILISGYGSNLQAILDAIEEQTLPAVVRAVISNRSDAYGLERARRFGIPAIPFPYRKEQRRQDYDRELGSLVADYQPDWVILAGWMRLLSMAFLSQFPNRVVNLHPAKQGFFPGTCAIQRAYDAYKKGIVQETGVMVHLVPDETVDAGPLLSQETVPIYPDDTLETLEARIHLVEHKLLVGTIRHLIYGDLLY